MINSTKIIPLPPVDWGDGIEKDVVLLELTNPEGITGLGSACTGVNQLQAALRQYQQNPAMLHDADAEMIIPMSAIDIALWDIRGKEENQPVSELLGGRKRDRVLAYATMNLLMTSALTGDSFEANLRDLMDQGFKAIKLSIDNFGHRDSSRSDSEWDLCEAKLLESARAIVGDNIELMLDVYGSDPNWTPDFHWAVKTASVLEELNYLWFEEPLTPEAVDDYARLTQGTNIAIAGGEDLILTKDFEHLATRKAVNILQPDCTRVGGLTAMQSIRTSAAKNHINLIPHGWNTAVGLAADLHLQATLADDKFCMVEVMPHSSITDLLEHNPFALDDAGAIAIPTGAGLGITLKDEIRP
jgi:D-galactarolactone cycloisomerase